MLPAPVTYTPPFTDISPKRPLSSSLYTHSVHKSSLHFARPTGRGVLSILVTTAEQQPVVATAGYQLELFVTTVGQQLFVSRARISHNRGSIIEGNVQQYVIGKCSMSPQGLLDSGTALLRPRDPEGVTFSYPQPADYPPSESSWSLHAHHQTLLSSCNRTTPAAFSHAVPQSQL